MRLRVITGTVARRVVAVALLLLMPVSATMGEESPNAEPSVVAAVIPEYPDIARQARVEGKVVLSVEVTPSGTVSAVHRKTGMPPIAIAAELAARRWLFTPSPTGSTVTLTFDYRLLEFEACNAEAYSEARPPFTVVVRGRLPWVDLCSDCPRPRPVPTQRPCQ